MAPTASKNSLWQSSNVQEADVIISETWEKALQSITRKASRINESEEGDRMILAVVGGKGLGKSTFVRLAANKIQASVSSDVRCFLIDTDPGQPILDLPGTLGLFEAKTMNSEDDTKAASRKRKKAASKKRPRSESGTASGQVTWEQQKSFFLGDTSPATHPSTFMDSIHNLVRTYETLTEGSPSVLILNFHGWTIGLGSEMANAMLKSANVNYVVHIRHTSRADTIEYDAKSLDRVYRLQPAHVGGSSEVAKDQRFERICHYFGAPSLTDLELKQSFPLRVPSDVEICTVREDEGLDADLLMAADGAFVGLCRRAPLDTNSESDDDADEDGNKMLQSNAFEYLGMGFVSYAGSDQVLHIVSPIKKETLFEQGITHVVLGSQGAPLMQWLAKNSESCSRKMHKPFFVDAELSVDLVPPSNVNKKNLKRRRLTHRKK
mmetsp:Transcript_8958/g.17645  ORF Transcript_8958/g.17645 Transcript_8958/m.17645 type:complete len:436 (+) Transcript_8958:540-1847(+)|eukprot:CAMPEP_0171487248 /NCGR_PEP_ID=MMETSP0958-20121227/1540_1 /TAXON_ID=87120 /ORGANISM="Aurantiochytrium limacinum, Strain ATCCMYA-1381" /LENGTH=435 /DNA_ID=CAMNT_0012020217 /DNA_START=213 /DNA_END=1520 /DNA_ORIENTATION=-